MNDGFFSAPPRATPVIRVADCRGNARAVEALIRTAAAQGVQAVVFPELCLTGYTCGDLFLQRPLLQAAEQELAGLIARTAISPHPRSGGRARRLCAARCITAPPSSAAAASSAFPPKRASRITASFTRPAISARLPPASRSRMPGSPCRSGTPSSTAPSGGRTAPSASRLRGSVAGPALHAARPRGRHAAAQPFRQRRGDRQGLLPPRSRARPVRAAAVRLCLCRRRGGRIHDGSRVLRPQPPRRERHAACGIGAVFHRPRAGGFRPCRAWQASAAA